MRRRPRRWLVRGIAGGVLLAVLGAGLSGGAVGPPPALRKSAVLADPPLGWSSWNVFGCAVTEQLVRATADALISSGMVDAGYRYVNVDDCWMAPQRDAQGRLAADPRRFPSGMAALGDYLHQRGLKFGIYSSAGSRTCQGLPASLDHEGVDAATFAQWGVDLLKYDNCNDEGRPALTRYRAMGEALARSDRDIAFAICEWGDNRPWEWAARSGGHSWRTAGDISDDWDSVLSILDRQVGLAAFSAPGGWNDPDSLEVGNGGLSLEENRSHFSLWAILNAPLLAGNDIRNMAPEILSILTNRDAIAVDQDWSGSQARRVSSHDGLEVWSKPLRDRRSAILFLNRRSDTTNMSTDSGQVGLAPAEKYAVLDVWTGTRTTAEAGALNNAPVGVPGHGVKLFVVTPA